MEKNNLPYKKVLFQDAVCFHYYCIFNKKENIHLRLSKIFKNLKHTKLK